MSFSERKGYKPLRTVLQVESMDDQLRASLWNLLHMAVWDVDGFMLSQYGPRSGRITEFARSVWFLHFKKPFGDIPKWPSDILGKIEEYFFACSWTEVYDFIEVVVDIQRDDMLERGINHVLEREVAGCRLVDRKFVDVTDPQEILALGEALGRDQFAPVAAHLKRALALLSDRKAPDYRNSIKESISAVEAIARKLTKKDKATLGDALKVLEKSQTIHPSLREGFSKLYGYANDAEGIRHAMLDEPNLTAADAKFFLLSCTSFINYLKARISV